ARELEISLSSLGERSRVQPITLSCNRLDDVCDQDQRRPIHKRIDPVTRWIGNHQHVALIDGCPTPQARCVKPEAVLKGAFVQLSDRKAEVMPRAHQIGEAHVYEFRLLIRSKLQYFLSAHGSSLRFEIHCTKNCRSKTSGGAAEIQASQI